MTEEQLNNAVLAGGVEIEVQYRTAPSPRPSPIGGEGEVALPTPEKVFVRELAVKEYPKLLTCLQSEEAQVELFCDQAAGWGETLRAASLNEIMKAGEALNKAPFFDWFARRMERTRALQPKEIEAFTKKAEAMLADALRTGSLKLQ